MSVTRRSFFKGGVISALFVAVPKCALAFTDHPKSRAVRTGRNEVGPTDPSNSTDPLSINTFSPYVGAEFAIVARGGRRVFATLSKTTDLREPVRDREAIDAGKECFALEFRTSGASLLDSGTYTFTGPVGTFPLFISPMMPTNGSLVYEAVINRLQG